jgi:hypothetical protein
MPDDPDQEDPAMTMTEPTSRNGADVDALFATIGAVRAQPELAEFTFRAANTWVDGTHSRTAFGTFEEQGRGRPGAAGADHDDVVPLGRAGGGGHLQVSCPAGGAPARSRRR